MINPIEQPTHVEALDMAHELADAIPRGVSGTAECIAGLLPGHMANRLLAEAESGRLGAEAEEVALASIWTRGAWLGSVTVQSDLAAEKSGILYHGVVEGLSHALSDRQPNVYDLGPNRPDHVIKRTVETARAIASLHLHGLHREDMAEGSKEVARQRQKGVEAAGLQKWFWAIPRVRLHELRGVRDELDMIAL